MSYFTVHRQDVYQDYKASPFSAAALLQLFLFGVMIGAPIALVAVNPDIWPMYNTVYEQPLVRYQQMALVNLDIGGGDTLSWSTLPQYNRLMAAKFRSAILKTKEIDLNRDKRPEQFRVILDIPLKAGEQVFGVCVFVFFDFILQKRTFFEMSTVATVQYSSASAGAEFYADGSLRFVQRDALRPGAYDYSRKEPLINISSSNMEDYSVITLMRTLENRNATTVLDVPFPAWRTGSTPDRPFHIELTIRLPAGPVWMETTVLHRLTTAGAAFTFWLLPFWLACRFLRRFVFSSGALAVVRNTKMFATCLGLAALITPALLDVCLHVQLLINRASIGPVDPEIEACVQSPSMLASPLPLHCQSALLAVDGFQLADRDSMPIARKREKSGSLGLAVH